MCVVKRFALLGARGRRAFDSLTPSFLVAPTSFVAAIYCRTNDTVHLIKSTAISRRLNVRMCVCGWQTARPPPPDTTVCVKYTPDPTQSETRALTKGRFIYWIFIVQRFRQSAPPTHRRHSTVSFRQSNYRLFMPPLASCCELDLVCACVWRCEKKKFQIDSINIGMLRLSPCPSPGPPRIDPTSQQNSLPNQSTVSFCCFVRR